MLCTELEPLIEALADGSILPSPAHDAHIASCAACSARLDEARRIERWLSTRDEPQVSTSFTASVMARVGQEQWRVERVVDFGFNLALAAAVLTILFGAAGAAWSLGLFTVTIDTDALLQAAGSQVEGRVINQVQTVLVAGVVLTIALVLWWWAEAATD